MTTTPARMGQDNEKNIDQAPTDLIAMVRQINEEYPWSGRYGFRFDQKHYRSVQAVLRLVNEVFGQKLDDVTFLRFREKDKRLITYIAASGVYFSSQDKGVAAYVMEELAIIEANSREEWASHERTSDTGLPPVQGELATEPSNPTIAIIEDKSLSALDRLIEDSDREQKNQLKGMKRRIAEAGLKKKPLALIKGVDLMQDFGADRYPNFSELLDYLQSQFDLAKLSNGALRIPPTLLVGPPGVGKTTFLRKLARRIGAEFHVENIASAQTGARLAGSEIFWSNTRPGIVFNSLAFGNCANPIIVLDELDKEAGVNGRNTLGALYELLEPATAATFQDASLPGVRLDASHVVWFATANNANNIDPVILSRFKVIDIPEPTKDQMPAVVASVYSDLLESNPWGRLFPRTLNEDLVTSIGLLPPREVRKTIEIACGNAAKAGRNWIEPSDVEIQDTRSRVGFV